MQHISNTHLPRITCATPQTLTYMPHFHHHITNTNSTHVEKHHYITTATPLQHHCNTTTTPLQHHYNTTATPLQHHCNTTTPPPDYYYNTTTTLLQHHCNTTTIQHHKQNLHLTSPTFVFCVHFAKIFTLFFSSYLIFFSSRRLHELIF